MAINVFVHDDAVDVDFTGLDRVEAFRSHLRLPMGVITDARVAGRDELRADLGWRLGGTYLPGRVIAGNFGAKGRRGVRQLWGVHRDEELLLLETRLERPWRVVLQHPDRDTLAWLIAERIHR